MKKNKILTSAIILGTMIFGTLNVNAATTYAEKLPDTVTRGPITYGYTSGTNTTTGKSNYPFYNEDTTGTYLLYCSDRNNDRYEHNDVLKKSSEKLPYGYVTILKATHEIDPIYGYILDGSYKEYTDKEQMKKMTNTWITQMALWGYQGTITEPEINFDQLQYKINEISGNVNLANKNVLLFRGTDVTSKESYLVAKNVWNSYVASLIQKAKSAKDPSDTNLNVTADKDGWTKSDNISKSGLITIAPSNGEAKISNYSIILEVPEDISDSIKLYTEDGKEVILDKNSEIGGACAPNQDCSNKKPYKIEGTPKLYLTIDNNKMDKSKEYNIKMNVYANISYDAAYMYTNDSGKQPSILVGPETKDIQGSLDLKIIPDTASSLSKSIYYIGFIVLLCGVGMIYANVRPKRQEEE